MLTRCPACATTFRVTPEQLKARLGRVRCGQCNTVFNSLDALVEEVLVPPVVQSDDAGEITSSSEGAAAITCEIPGAGVEEDLDDIAESAADTESSDGLHPALVDAENDELAPPTPPAVDSVESTGTESVATSSTVQRREKAPADVADNEAIAPLAFEEALNPAPGARRWPLVAGSLIAAIALLVQAVMHFRTELAVLQPVLKPILSEACAILGCELRLPQKVDQLGIDASDLQPAGSGKDLLQLTATLHNRAPFVQEYPLLELTLTDVADKPLIVKSLQPTEYLPETHAAASGFGADSELPITLLLDARNVPAAGYRLYLYYP